MPTDRPATAEISSIVKDFILDRFLPGEDPANLTDETPLITGGVLDSISTVTLVAFLEQRFGVQFQAHEMSADYLDSTSAIAATVTDKLGS
jgi:acyl carrier protein